MKCCLFFFPGFFPLAELGPKMEQTKRGAEGGELKRKRIQEDSAVAQKTLRKVAIRDPMPIGD